MKNKKLSIIVFIGLLILASVFLCVFSFSSINKKTGQILNLQKEIAAAEKEFFKNKSLGNFIGNLKEKKEKIDTVFFVSENGTVKIIEDLEFIAAKTGSGIKFNNININDGVVQKPLIQFFITGRFDQVFRYLALLENLPYLINFEKIQCKKDQSAWGCDFEITLSSFIKL